MIDSGAATHVCPTWFAPDSPLYTLQQGQGPSLRTATDEEITIHGYKWVLMTNQHNYQEDIDDQEEAKKAKGLPTPPQPTEQERMEHELTHLPYRSWCPVCVRSKGRADNHPKQHSKSPVIQVDITYYKAMGETKVTPILTAVDVETGMCMAVQVEDRTQQMQYLATCLQQFLMECGRTQATLNNTVI